MASIYKTMYIINCVVRDGAFFGEILDNRNIMTTN